MGRYSMVLEYREREHEDMDREAMRNASTLHALQQCSLLKFYCTSGMRANVYLLETLISYWDHDLGVFDLQEEILEITVEDITLLQRFPAKACP